MNSFAVMRMGLVSTGFGPTQYSEPSYRTAPNMPSSAFIVVPGRAPSQPLPQVFVPKRSSHPIFRPVIRPLFGIGASVGLGDASSDLAAIKSLAQTGDAQLQQGLFDQAVVSYQAGGQLGAVTVGPEIDAQTNGASVNLTQQAWGINGSLASINSSVGNGTSATQNDATTAQGLLAQMTALYDQAIALASSPTVQPSSALQSAAQAVVSYFQNNPCTQSSVSVVTAFQTQYNAEGSQALTVDGKYGPNTQGAVQRVLNVSGGGTAPANCFGGSPRPVTPTPGPTPVPTPTPGTTTTAGTNWGTVALIAAAVAGTGIIGYAAHKRGYHKTAMHHLRRAHHAARRHLRLRHA